jgi:hypothetical protein
MAGSVKPVDLWLLVEYRGRWEREAVAVFSESIQSRIRALKSRTPGMRFALIKQPERTSGPLSVFWAFSRERNSQLFRSEIFDYDELSCDSQRPGEPMEAKIMAVCTHGTHDLCCAQFGNKIYAELRARNDNVWQISHIGGCRFAPNVVALPHGIVYGRVEPADCAEIIASYQRGEVMAEKMRGRSCYAKPVQAAEQFLRTHKQLPRLEDLTMTAVHATGQGQWSIDFLSRGFTPYRIFVTSDRQEPGIYKSCDATELSPRERFQTAECL